jgi:iron-sulfur cluster repair protein YtfE (RIC family)
MKMPDVNELHIDPSWTINELLRREPSIAVVLNAFGVDSCCGGGDTIDAAASAAGINGTVLIDAIAVTLRCGAVKQ